MKNIYKTLGKYHLAESDETTLYDISNEVSFSISKAYKFLSKASSIVRREGDREAINALSEFMDEFKELGIRWNEKVKFILEDSYYADDDE